MWGQSASSGPAEEIYLVVLRQACVAEHMLQEQVPRSRARRRELLAGDRAAGYRRLLERDQQEFLDRFDGVVSTKSKDSALPPGDPAWRLVVLDRQTDLINLLVVRAGEEALEILGASREVAGVYPNLQRWPMLDAAPTLVSAPAAWQKVGGVDRAGAGLRIAILDSGINLDHPMFQDGTLSAPAGFPRPTEFAAFTNDKVIVARDYALTRYGLRPESNPVPRDLAGHGSRVAAAAAGNRVLSPAGPANGIAPKAFLGNYRVFGDPQVNPTTTSAAVIAAVNDAVADGMDVVNLSLGGPAVNPAFDPEQQVIANAVALGVVAVVAAGNNGARGPGSITSPGTSPAVITVGATSHVRTLLNALRIQSDSQPLPPPLDTIEFLPGNGAPLAQRLGPLPLVSITELDPSGEACQSLPAGSLSGQVPLVRRGTCLFADKAQNVLGSADATAMVLYNNVPGPPVRADFGSPSPTRPAGMITLQEGEQLLQLLEQGQSLEVILEPLLAVPRKPDILADFSGRGPNLDGSIKPDLVAPGVEILSAGNSGDSYVLSSQGTSFATPLVAGTAALLLQLNPGWSPAQVKSALVNSATLATLDGLNPASVLQAGAGRLELSAATAATLSLNPVSLSFGNLLLVGGVLPPQALQISNTSADDVQLELDYTTAHTDLRIQLPDSLTLAPGESIQIQAQPVLTGSPAPGTFEGFVLVQPGSGPTLKVPFWGALLPAASGNVLQVSQLPGAQFADLRTALAVALPGDTVEILDSETYAGPFEIRRNRNGAALHGVTLRAGPSQQPQLQAPAEAAAVLTVTGVENVTIQGLRVRGGQRGISFVDSSGVIRDNDLGGDRVEAVFVDHGRVHLYKNLIRGGPGRGVGLFRASSALIQGNQVGEPALGRGDFGIFAAPESVVSLFGNHVLSTLSEDNGQGIRLSGSISLLENNLISGSRGARADGVAVLGSASVADLKDNLITGNARYGVALFDGAGATLLRDRVRSNMVAGLLVQDSTAQVQSSSFLANRTGVESFFAERLTMDSSLIAGSVGDGLRAVNLPETELLVGSSTIADNGGSGIHWADGPLDLSNTILWNNLSGDLDGDQAGQIRFNLLDHQQWTGSDGNYSGNPRLQSDYSLAADSDAIDQGPEGSPVSSRGDLHSRVRIVDGNLDGLPVIDTGASEYGAPGTPSLVLPLLNRQAGEFLGLAMANVFDPPVEPGPEAAGTAGTSGRVLLRHYDPSGELQEERIVTIPAGRQNASLVEQLFPRATGGWIEIIPFDPDLLSFALMGSNDLRYLDGSHLEAARSRRLVLPETHTAGEDQTWVYLVNPRSQTQQVTIQWVGEGGARASQQRELGPKSMLAFSVEQLFSTTDRGYLLVESDEPISGLEIFGNERRLGGLAGLIPSEGITQLMGAQLASSTQIETHLNLVNLGDEALVTLSAMDESGALLDQVSLPLSAGEQVNLPVRQIFELPNQPVVGWLAVRSLSGGLAGCVRFGDPGGDFLAALPLQEQGAREFLLSQVAQTTEIFTGLALLNPNPETALASLEVFSREGQLSGVAFLVLGPRQKLARLLSELVPEITQQSGGFIRVRSTHPLAGFELFGDQELTFLSAVPQQVVMP